MIKVVDLEILSTSKIKEMYKDGRRNFDGIKCTGGLFSNTNLSGASFRNADMSFSDFSGSNLSNTDFTNTNLCWSDFKNTNFTNAKLFNADLSWSALIDTIFDNTDVSNANFSWSLMININLSKCKQDGANFGNVAKNWDEITDYGMQMALKFLNNANIPARLKAILNSIFDKKSGEYKAAREFTIVSKILDNNLTVYKPLPVKEEVDSASGYTSLHLNLSPYSSQKNANNSYTSVALYQRTQVYARNSLYAKVSKYGSLRYEIMNVDLFNGVNHEI